MAAHADLCVIMVTYGDRAELCIRALRALWNGTDTPGAVVLVLNGVTASSESELVAQVGPHLRLVRTAANRGSAGGYADGLRGACAGGWRRFWLLDDDNAPDPDALVRLLGHRRRLGGADALVAVAAARVDRATTPRGGRFRPSRSSFLNFNAVDVPSRLRRGGVPEDGCVTVPYGPYGGLLLDRATVERIGLPDERLFAYEDDVEYTWRITAAGGSVVVAHDSRVRDLEGSWFDRPSGNGLVRSLLADSDWRSYAGARNRVHFERHHYARSRALYAVNRGVYLALLRAAARRHGRHDRYALIRAAVRDGEAGRFATTGPACAR